MSNRYSSNRRINENYFLCSLRSRIEEGFADHPDADALIGESAARDLDYSIDYNSLCEDWFSWYNDSDEKADVNLLRPFDLWTTFNPSAYIYY